MSRIWDSLGPKVNGRAEKATVVDHHRSGSRRPQALTAAPAPVVTQPEPDDDYYDEEPERYVVRPVRPIAQVALRVALWGGVGLGAAAGLVSLVRPPKAELPPAEVEDTSDEIPAPVAGMAELAIESWLTASPDDSERMDALFVEDPALDGADPGTLEVLDVKTVAGINLDEGYWSVTVAARVVEPLGDGTAGAAVTWFVEVGVVGDVGTGLSAFTTPAIVPAPRLGSSPWQTAADSTEIPSSDDDLARTVEDFLVALLAGTGDPERYLATDVHIPAARPAPFVGVEVREMSVTEMDPEESDGPCADEEATCVRIWVLAELTTAADSKRVSGYEIITIDDLNRWEILSIWGAPAVEPAPESETPTDDASTTPNAGDGTATTTTAVPDTTTTTVDLSGESGGDDPASDGGD